MGTSCFISRRHISKLDSDLVVGMGSGRYSVERMAGFIVLFVGRCEWIVGDGYSLFPYPRLMLGSRSLLSWNSDIAWGRSETLPLDFILDPT